MTNATAAKPGPLAAPNADEINLACKRLEGIVHRTPLVPLALGPGTEGIYLKLESLQRFGSFKIRAAMNAIATLEANDPRSLDCGIVTASAGNFGQGLAAAAHERRVACTVLVPEHAARTKIEAMEQLGANIKITSFDQWWEALETRVIPGVKGRFIHPVADPAVIAGNATIGMEILDDLTDVDTVLVPVGGGGLAAGVGATMQLRAPSVRTVAAESDAAGQVAAALAADRPVAVDHRKTFIDGAGGRIVLAEMWPLLKSVLSGSVSVSVDAVRDTVRRLARERCLVVEGAGATPVAAALAGLGVEPGKKTVCVVSGGNLDADVLAGVLANA